MVCEGTQRVTAGARCYPWRSPDVIGAISLSSLGAQVRAARLTQGNKSVEAADRPRTEARFGAGGRDGGERASETPAMECEKGECAAAGGMENLRGAMARRRFELVLPTRTFAFSPSLFSP